MNNRLRLLLQKFRDIRRQQEMRFHFEFDELYGLQYILDCVCDQLLGSCKYLASTTLSCLIFDRLLTGENASQSIFSLGVTDSRSRREIPKRVKCQIFNTNNIPTRIRSLTVTRLTSFHLPNMIHWGISRRFLGTPSPHNE